MKIVITGCTGFVGREIVPLLAAAGADLLLVGRNPDKIRKTFPGFPIATYEDMAERARGFDLLAHMAALNNNVEASLEEFRRVNVGITLETLERARAARIERFVHFSTVHALIEKSMSHYDRSKREAAAAISAADIDAVTLFLPTVYGRQWGGKLSMLNRLPRWASTKLFAAIAALKPVVEAGKIADFLIDGAPAMFGGEAYLYEDKDKNPIFGAAKRSVELTFAIVILLLFWWLFAILWVFVRVQSPGPGIFAQSRVGRFGKLFTCYKFRTMVNGTRQCGTHEVSVSAVTSIGRFLRKTKLDELPQVWNILRNEMSLVGPRPCLPVQTELINRRAEANVFHMKPGITGYAQICDVDMSDPDRLTVYDARYNALRSLTFDFAILVATFLGRGQGDRTAQ
jgi:lipopolysaccharide/colanic/teichoic acid biosynthesis glycosyltransferase